MTWLYLAFLVTGGSGLLLAAADWNRAVRRDLVAPFLTFGAITVCSALGLFLLHAADDGSWGPFSPPGETGAGPRARPQVEAQLSSIDDQPDGAPPDEPTGRSEPAVHFVSLRRFGQVFQAVLISAGGSLLAAIIWRFLFKS